LAGRRPSAPSLRAVSGLRLPGGRGVRDRAAGGDGDRPPGHRLRPGRPHGDGRRGRERPLFPRADPGGAHRRPPALRGLGLQPRQGPRPGRPVRRGRVPARDGRLRRGGPWRSRRGRRPVLKERRLWLVVALLAADALAAVAALGAAFAVRFWTTLIPAPLGVP